MALTACSLVPNKDDFGIYNIFADSSSLEFFANAVLKNYLNKLMQRQLYIQELAVPFALFSFTETARI